MRKRRYREKNASITVACHNGKRIHDFLKGWGTICKDGSILWDSWKPPTKKQLKEAEKCLNRLTDPNHKITFPVIKRAFPKLSVDDIVSVQPMQKYES